MGFQIFLFASFGLFDSMSVLVLSQSFLSKAPLFSW
jgi:hypothetical protein